MLFTSKCSVIPYMVDQLAVFSNSSLSQISSALTNDLLLFYQAYTQSAVSHLVSTVLSNLKRSLILRNLFNRKPPHQRPISKISQKTFKFFCSKRMKRSSGWLEGQHPRPSMCDLGRDSFKRLTTTEMKEARSHESKKPNIGSHTITDFLLTPSFLERRTVYYAVFIILRRRLWRSAKQ